MLALPSVAAAVPASGELALAALPVSATVALTLLWSAGAVYAVSGMSRNCLLSGSSALAVHESKALSVLFQAEVAKLSVLLQAVDAKLASPS